MWVNTWTGTQWPKVTDYTEYDMYKQWLVHQDGMQKSSRLNIEQGPL